MLADVGGGDLLDVLAVIAAFGESSGFAGGLAHPRLHAEAQVGDLDAGIVVVELADDLVAGPLEQSRDCVSQRRLPAVTDMQAGQWDSQKRTPR